MGEVVGERYRLDVYIVSYLRDAFPVVLDYCSCGPHVLGDEAANIVGRVELCVTWVVIAQIRAVYGWPAVPISEGLRAQVELAVVSLFPEDRFDGPIQCLIVFNAIRNTCSYSVSQRHSARWSSLSTSPSSMSEKMSGPHTLTYSTVSGWT